MQASFLQEIPSKLLDTQPSARSVLNTETGTSDKAVVDFASDQEAELSASSGMCENQTGGDFKRNTLPDNIIQKPPIVR